MEYIDRINAGFQKEFSDDIKSTLAEQIVMNLLELYSKKRMLSENFYTKRIFYELFTEVNHYFDAKRDIKTSNIVNISIDMIDVLSSI